MPFESSPELLVLHGVRIQGMTDGAAIARRFSLDEAVAVNRRNLGLLQRELHMSETLASRGLLSDVEVMRLFREPLKLIVAQDHPLASRPEVLDADLAGEDILTLPSTYLLHNQIVALCEETGAHLRQDYEGTSLDALRQMTALNMGLSFLPALYVDSEVSPEAGDVVVLPFRRNRLTRSIGLVWRRRSAHRAMIERIAGMIRAVAQDRFSGLVVVE